MIIGLDSDFSVCLCWVHALFLGYCFFSGFLECVLAVCFLFYWPAWLVSSGEFLLVLEAGGREREGKWSVDMLGLGNPGNGSIWRVKKFQEHPTLSSAVCSLQLIEQGVTT